MEKRIPPSSGLFHNAFRVVTNDKGLAPRRFTDSRIAVFDRSELYSVRARSSAGVALRFRLAAPTARIGYALERVHRGIPRADLFIDGAYAKTFELGPQDRDAEGSLEVASPSAEGAEIELVLPYQATFTLTGITLPEGGTVEPVQEPKGLFSSSATPSPKASSRRIRRSPTATGSPASSGEAAATSRSAGMSSIPIPSIRR